MAKDLFKIKNIHNFTKEQALGQPVNFQYYKAKEPIPLGIVTDIDEDYLYIDFEHNNNDDIVIEVNNNRLDLTK